MKSFSSSFNTWRTEWNKGHHGTHLNSNFFTEVCFQLFHRQVISYFIIDLGWVIIASRIEFMLFQEVHILVWEVQIVYFVGNLTTTLNKMLSLFLGFTLICDLSWVGNDISNPYPSGLPWWHLSSNMRLPMWKLIRPTGGVPQILHVTPLHRDDIACRSTQIQYQCVSCIVINCRCLRNIYMICMFCHILGEFPSTWCFG